MIYEYRCTNCQEEYEVVQGVNDKHEYRCPTCDQKCVREFTVPQMRLNQEFFSYTLPSGSTSHPGKWVSGQTQFEEELARTRYVSGNSERMGDTYAKDEWIEAREKKKAEDAKEIRSISAETDRAIENAEV